MEIKNLAVRFTETAAEEIDNLVRDMRLIPLAGYLTSSKQPVPDELKQDLQVLLSVLFDLFSVELPDIEKNPEAALRTVSRDINLARLLRERGLFRLYRLVNEHVGVNDLGKIVPASDPEAWQRVPAFMTRVNPSTGAPFARQEEFIGWFCEEAHVSRGLVFMRLAAIERMLSIGFTLEEAFKLIVLKPFAVQETLASIAEWDKGELKSISSDVVRQLSKKIDPDNASQISDLINLAETDDDARAELREAAKPLIAGLIQEVAGHDRAKDAMEFVRRDILGRPEISYSWDTDSNALIVELVQRHFDQDTGTEYMGAPVIIPFVPDALDLPAEIKYDLIKRLPIRNRHNLD